MKREIKFRAWSKKTKKIYKDVIHVNLNSSEGIWTTVLRNDPFEGKTVHYSIQPEHCEIMQYTGLKDKNGIDIYEGDILENPENKTSVVVWTLNGYFAESQKDDRITSIPLSLCFVENKKIIGNVYENPELLNK